MKKLLCLFFLMTLSIAAWAQVTLSHLKIEGIENPIGIDDAQPAMSWILNSELRDVKQTAYQIRVFASSPNGKEVWNSGKVDSDQSVEVAYKGAALKSDERYYWQVRVWDNSGKVSKWSTPAYWQTAFLNKSDWKASWIEVDGNSDDDTRSPYFRKTFDNTKRITSATAYITSHGMYEAYLNGKKIGDACLTPGWTSYTKRLQYQVYDVTSMVNSGKNTIGAVLANGWYRGTLNWEPREKIYGDKLGLLLQLEIKYSDGTTQTVISDDTWRYSTGEIVYSELYNGETTDAGKAQKGWSESNFNDSKWSAVTTANYGYDNLIATYNQPVKKQEKFTADKVIKTPKGETVLDFGQNLVGWEQVRIKGQKGDTIRIYHAEVLDKDGNFYTENLRAAKSISTYILSGEEDIFEPRFTFYGFRYIKIEGVDGEIDPTDFTATALYSDMPLNGNFTSSNALINQLQKNITWGQKGNFLDIPTDCPQRNERLGWTGDAHAFFRTAVYNRDGRNFFKKWLKDLAADQLPDGRVPYVIPHTLREDQTASTGWGDASTIIPWQLYMAYGDKEVLSEQYPSMKAWVEYMNRNSVDNLWNTEKFHFGDWLFFRPDDDKDGIAAITDKYMIAQCFFAHSVQMILNSAQVLGYDDDAKKYADLLDKVKAAYVREYMTPNGRLVSSTQTAYVLALNFDMLPEDQRAQAVDRLVENIERYNNHITTGFLGTPYICHVLSRFGRSDVAYRLLFQRTYPSWLYPVTVGATTIWERWDARKPNGTFQTAEMNSFNHYAYGAIGDWLYRVAAGLTESAPGYKEIIIKPHLGGEFTSIEADQMTPYGKASSKWAITDGHLTLEVEIPANTTAKIYVPTSDTNSVTESGNAVSGNTETNGYVAINVGSGKYKFKSKI